MKLFLIPLFLFITHVFFGQISIPYNLKKPDLLLTLPDTLREVSGIAILDSTSIACIQDENGIIFIYNIKQKKLKQQFTFATNGDYEGIALVDKTLYVLRSDGVLFEINDFASKNRKTKQYLTGIPAMNNEGLCYDKLNNRLLIGCKGKINKDAYYHDKRFIYEFKLSTKKLNPKPLISFNLIQISSFAKEHNIKLPQRRTKNGKTIETGFKVNTSEIAINPESQKLYLLSATDHCLFIFSISGTLEYMEILNSNLFNKAEGISFFENGDLLISNEAQNKKATLLRFNLIR